MKKIRVELVLTESDIDIIEEMQSSGLQRATFFKMATRSYMRNKEEERFDERVKRLLSEVIAQSGMSNTVIEDVKPKKKLGFGSKRVYAD